MLGDPAIPLWITEGVKKADCGALNGLCIVALPGVWSWRGRTAGRQGRRWRLERHRAQRPPRHSRVRRRCRPEGVGAESVGRAGRIPEKQRRPRRIPVVADTDDKTGLDDYLADGHTVEDLWRLVNPTAPPLAGEDPPRPPGQRRPRRTAATSARRCTHVPARCRHNASGGSAGVPPAVDAVHRKTLGTHHRRRRR